LLNITSAHHFNLLRCVDRTLHDAHTFSTAC
jgi:hypothetical protein